MILYGCKLIFETDVIKTNEMKNYSFYRITFSSFVCAKLGNNLTVASG
jgi:hypothetical protein